MLLHTLEHGVYDIDRIPEEIDNMYYGVLDNSCLLYTSDAADE